MQIPREEFERRVADIRALKTRGGRWLALWSVLLAAVVLYAIHLSKPHLGQAGQLVLAVVIFAVYLAVLGLMVLNLQVRVRKARITCPACNIVLDDIAERMALADGICDDCNERIIS